MRIGTLARLSGATHRAIRLYEARGLLAGVSRHGQYRHYQPEHLQQIRLIRQALGLGLRLGELQQLLRPQLGSPDWPALLERLQQRQQQVQAEIQRLEQCAAALQQCADELRACLAGNPAQDCSGT